ncbi:MAG TPA: hypothetical protein VM074_06665 [Solimonas sp.]|nr:hypothetical protein [Solimonas sp.]
MGLISHRGWLSTVVVAVALAGCGSSDRGGGTQGAGGPLSSKYDLASRCVVLKANGAYAVRDGDAFVANGHDAAGAEHFFMKAAGLGRYVFYTADGAFLTGSGTAVSAATAPEDGSDWTLEGGAGSFTASTLGKALAVDGTGALLQGDAPAQLAFEPASGCSEYPEMPVGIDAPTFKSNPVGSPVIGFAEVHAHMGMGSEMSDGSGNVGPSAGGVMYGQAINRFGVLAALDNCEAIHGPDGTLSSENIVLDQDPTETHDTVGWPTFIGWPQKDSQLHQQMYYKWVERAYKAGLRTMVIHGTNIEALCDVAKATGGDRDQDLEDVDCTDMGVGTKQVKYLYDIEKYVDAQEGGPGKGWFKIVKDPAQARSVIADGKMAVIPGLEFSNIFHCSVSFTPLGGETSSCTKEDIDREIDEVWDLGVRAVFPYHDVDSALGGTGIFEGAALNLVGFNGTHGFWKTYDCENGGEGPDFFYNAGAYMYSEQFPPLLGNDPITQALMDATGGVLPLYPTGKRQCNARDVTDLGKYAIDRIMKKGFTLDIDHAEIRSKQYMLDQGARFTPNYPMISAHGGHGGISNAQVVQIVRQGGIVYPAVENGKDMASFILQKLKPLWLASGTTRPLAVGYGADSNGLRNLPGPRGAGTTPIAYPFTLFQGPGWGPQYAAAGIAPIKVDMLSIPDGQSWNMDEVGMAHYGLVADVVEEIRIEGGQEATDAFYRSAETYLKLWEQTLAASAEARKVPSP